MSWRSVVCGGCAGLLVGLLIAIAIAGASDAANSRALVSRLQRHYRATDSFTAHFNETLTSPGGTPRERTGKVAYRKPGMIRWEFDPPQREVIVADGTTLYDYDPGLNQVVKMPERSAFRNRSVAAFILGAGDLERDFDVRAAAAGARDNATNLTLAPKEGGTPIEVGVDVKTLNIIRLRTVDALGNATELKLSDIQRNSAPPTAMFTFTVPPGADIVDAAPRR